MIKPWARKYICIDTETTGLGEDAFIVELAIVCMSFGKVMWSYCTLLSPPEIDWKQPSVVQAMEANRIDPMDLKEAPAFRDVQPRIIHMLEDAKYVVGHNLRFDVRMLENEFRRNTTCSVPLEPPLNEHTNIWLPENRFCTMGLDKVLNPFISGRSLEAVRAKWNVQRGDDQVHRAGSDAIVAGRIFAEMCQRIEDDLETTLAKQQDAIEDMDRRRAESRTRNGQ